MRRQRFQGLPWDGALWAVWDNRRDQSVRDYSGGYREDGDYPPVLFSHEVAARADARERSLAAGCRVELSWEDEGPPTPEQWAAVYQLICDESYIECGREHNVRAADGYMADNITGPGGRTIIYIGIEPDGYTHS